MRLCANEEHASFKAALDTASLTWQISSVTFVLNIKTVGLPRNCMCVCVVHLWASEDHESFKAALDMASVTWQRTTWQRCHQSQWFF